MVPRTFWPLLWPNCWLGLFSVALDNCFSASSTSYTAAGHSCHVAPGGERLFENKFLVAQCSWFSLTPIGMLQSRGTFIFATKWIICQEFLPSPTNPTPTQKSFLASLIWHSSWDKNVHYKLSTALKSQHSCLHKFVPWFIRLRILSFENKPFFFPLETGDSLTSRPKKHLQQYTNGRPMCETKTSLVYLWDTSDTI